MLANRSSAQRPDRCSDFVLGHPTRNVLFVGSERSDEFADALRLDGEGHDVTVINPRLTLAARAFQSRNGRFVPVRVERLPDGAGSFDMICENYPYPLRRYAGLAKKFALARLRCLAPGGRWILHTESQRFATALKALADFDTEVAPGFMVRVSALSPQQAPPSFYPAINTRFRVIFQRRR